MPTNSSFIPAESGSAKSAMRYARLVELTHKITGIASPPEGYGQWEALVRVWALYHKSIQCDDVLVATLHFIKWGAYPHSENEPLRWALNKGTPLEAATAELMVLFREELTSPGAEGALELHSWNGFKGVYHLLSNNDKSNIDHGPESYSRVHRDFLNARFDHLVHAFDPTDDRWDSYKEFEEIIHILLPTSITWTTTEWVDEHFILQQLDLEFGTSFQSAPDWLTWLVYLAAAALQSDVGFTFVLTRLPELPYDLAKRIWPVNTITHISEAYKAVVQEARENERRARRRKSQKLEVYEFGYADVKTTGIHQLMTNLISHGVITEPSMKRNVFEMGFGK